MYYYKSVSTNPDTILWYLSQWQLFTTSSDNYDRVLLASLLSLAKRATISYHKIGGDVNAPG